MSKSAPIRTVIIDDEPAARRGVALLLADDPDIVVVGEAGDRDGAVKLLESEHPELAFLDIQMPGGDGFSVLSALPAAERPVVIFATAYDEHALKAFEFHALDYLLKPFEDSRFASALQHAKAAVRGRSPGSEDGKLEELLRLFRELQPTSLGGGGGERDRVLVKSSGEILFLKPEEIDWIEAEGDYMKFHVAGKSHLMRETMARLEARLDARRFVRIHRSVIVNLDRVRKLTPSFGGDYQVVLLDGTSLKLSRGFHDRLSALLRQSL